MYRNDRKERKIDKQSRMKVLIIGGTGMLGHKLVQILGRRFEVFSTIRGDFETVERFGIFERERTICGLDVRRISDLTSMIEKIDPDVVINSVGIVKQHHQASDVVRMLEINSIFPHKLAELSESLGYRLVTMSTDCVFAGTKGNYTEGDTVDALDLYGQSKHFGEVSGSNCLTIRSSIIGRELFGQRGLLEWFIGQRGKTVDGYTNAVFSGFPTLVFADIIIDIVENQPSLSGVYHISSEPISKYDLLCGINECLDLGIKIQSSNEFRIDRSLDSSRFRNLTGFQPLAWESMLDLMASDATPYETWKNRQS